MYIYMYIGLICTGTTSFYLTYNIRVVFVDSLYIGVKTGFLKNYISDHKCA